MLLPRDSGQQLTLPAVITATTLDELLAFLDVAFYPQPSPGFKARWGVLMGMTVLYILLALLYAGQHLYSTTERPRWRSMWILRRVERPSGRFLVLNPRAMWTIPAVYGFFVIAYLVVCYDVVVNHASQAAWFVVRGINAPLLFTPGWFTSFAGLQSFLIAAESTGSRPLAAPLANTIFVGVGTVVFLVNAGLGIASAVLGVKFWSSFETLRAALLATKAAVGDRVPTVSELLPLLEPSQRFVDANTVWKSPGVWQFAIICLLPAACIIVNGGGIFLSLRLRRAVNESVDTLAFVEARNSALVSGKSVPLAVSHPSRRGSASPHLNVDVELDHLGLEGVKTGEFAGLDETETRRPTLTTGEVRFLAKGAGGSMEQARKVLALQKAMRELVTVSTTITVVSTAFLVDAVLLAYWSSDNTIYRGMWSITETAVLLPCWIYAVPVLISLAYLNFNSYMNAPIATTFSSSPFDSTVSISKRGKRCRPPAVAIAPATSFLNHFVDNSKSASTASGHDYEGDEGDGMSGALGRAKALDEEEAIEGEDGTGTGTLKSGGAGARQRTGSLPTLLASPAEWSSASPSESRQGQRKSWLSIGGKGSSLLGGGGGGKGGRPLSVAGQGLVITVAVRTEEVCDSRAEWELEDRERTSHNEEEGRTTTSPG